MSITKYFKQLYCKYIPAEIRDLRFQLFHEAKYLYLFFDYIKKRKLYISDTKREFLPSQFKYYLCVAAIIYNEADYIAEWLEYHLLVGVNKFIIYDNESTDNVLEVLKPYIAQGILDYYYWPGRKLELHKYSPNQRKYFLERNRWVHKIQRKAYADAVSKMKYSSFWLSFIDIDEFIVPISNETIPEFLYNFEDQAGILINWLIYGHSGHLKKSENLIIERFQHHSKLQFPKNSQTKLIVNPRHVFYQRTHSTWFFCGKKAVNSSKQEIGSIEYKPTHDKIRINHYHSKSYEEWLLRRKEKNNNTDNSGFTDEFNNEESERNIIKDDIIMHKYIEPVKTALKIKFNT